MAVRKRWLAWAVVGAAGLACWGQAWGQAGVGGRSDMVFAREMLRLNQGAALTAAAADAQAAGKPAALLFEAQAVVVGWDEIKKSRSKMTEMGGRYVEDMTKYLDAIGAGDGGAGRAEVDGRWATEEAKFIFGDLSESVLNRMEYWANDAKNRAELAPMAALADRLVKLAGERLAASLAALETDAERRKYPTEDAYTKAYMGTYDAKTEVDYYRAWDSYLLAMATPPSTPEGDQAAERKEELTKGVKALKDWADGPAESGVKYQSLLLRGKMYSELGRIDADAEATGAIKDLTAAAGAPDEQGADGSVKSLAWVRHQARYQLVVAKVRAAKLAGAAGGKADFKEAQVELGRFRQWIDSQGGAPEARISADVLAYRVARAEAELKPAAEREAARSAAMEILAGIITREPRFRDLVLEQLAAEEPENRKPADMTPLEALAVAWSAAQAPEDAGGTGGGEAMRRSLARAVDAAEAVRRNTRSTADEMREATLVKAVSSARLNNLAEAAALNLEFATKWPEDARSKELVETALGQIGQLRKAGVHTPALDALTQNALDLATGQFKDARWQYARGAMLLEQGKFADAQKIFENIAPGDANYLEAQYQLVLVSVQEGAELARRGAPAADQRAAAAGLLKACATYLRVVDAAPAEAKGRLASTLVDLRLIEISTAIAPLDDAKMALTEIESLERDAKQNKVTLTDQQRAGVLRYRIVALSKLGDSNGVAAAVRQLDPKEAPGLIKNLVVENQREIDQIEGADPQRAQSLAATVAELLDQLIALTKEAKDVYVYQQWRGDMLARAGKVADAEAVWAKLREEKPDDLLNNMGEARAMYLGKEYAKAEDYFARILPRLPVGSESYWEAYLRIIESREAQGKNMDDAKRHLKDLKIGDPEGFGGKTYKREFAALADKYGI